MVVDKIHSAEVMKQELLPLQGKTYWQVWTKLERERYGMAHCDIPTVEARIMSLKKGRAISLRCLTPLMETFLSSLLQCPACDRRYYLQFIKLYLDEYSRKHIRQLNSNHQVCMQQCKTSEEIQKCKKTHFEALNKVSLGLEHVLRETGQVYEAARESYSKSNRLPELAAELLIEGYPLELLDGDSAHVPLEWVSAVLEKVAKMLHDPKIFVLSVLGLQSSGKSTLLNATFGLQFAVSAGRCTRGAFMQLLPICDEMKDKLDCKHLLVVDTEGLRAPDLGMDPKHDNEFATFVIGLANVTMININGEIPADIEDILQTVIYAFIRMKRVTLKPSCQFVHQNVPSVLALGKGEMGRHLFKDKLDQVTKMIAEAEDVADKLTCFSDVITFDAEKDIHHFPGLWNGEIPMAHYSQGYCDKTQVLRSRILELMSKQSDRFSSFKRRLEDLWKALLNENFILNFRNSLEAIAYKYLEAEIGKWTWEFQRKILKWNEQSKIEIKNSEIQHLPELENRLVRNLTQFANEIHSELDKNVEIFFQESKYHDILSIHEPATRVRLDSLKDNLVRCSREQCKQAVDLRHFNSNVHEIKAKHDKKIKNQIAILADNLKQSDNLQIEEEFNKEWKIWIQELSNECKPVHKPDISNAFKVALKDEFKQNPLLLDKLKKDLENEWGETLSISICCDKHFERVDHDKLRNTVKMSAQHRKANFKELLEYAANQELQRVEIYVKTKKDEVFNSMFANELIKMMIGSIDMMRQCNPKWAKHIKLSEEFILDMNLIACGYASKEFDKMEHELRRKYDLVEYFRGEKEFYHIYFQRLHSQVATDAAAASSFCQRLSKPIKERVIASLGPAIVSDMKITCRVLQTKSALKANILIELAEDLMLTRSFKQYLVYLLYPEGIIWKSLVEYTKDYCMQVRPDRSVKNIVYLAIDELRDLFHLVRRQIVTITKYMPNQDSTIDGKNWLSKICKDQTLQQTLHLDFQACHDFSVFEKLSKETFLEEILQGIEALENSLLKEFENMTRDYVDNLPEVPYVTLYKSMKGCEEICPFCSEQCERGFQHTGDHTINQHRPQCLGGYKIAKTDEMVLKTCNELIETSNKFKNKDVKKWHQFREYRQIYPNWAIKQDLSSKVSLYWKWLVGNYPTIVSDLFNIKAANIPPQWKALKWEEIKENLLQEAMITD